MVGGIIDSVFIYTDRTSVIVRGTGCEQSDVLGIDLEPIQKQEASALRPALSLEKGDTIWWQDRLAYWTPADKEFQDVPIARIGYSYRP